MRALTCCACVLLLTTTFAAAQQPQTTTTPVPRKTDHTSLESMFETKVKTEWDAFKNKDKRAYSDLLADDFAGVEDDNQGMRTKKTAADEIDRSVINSYNLFALKATPLNGNAALVTYELTMLFPPRATVRFKRVLIAELWLKREGQWKLRYYQETRVR